MPSQMTLESAIARFVEFLSVERNLAPRTIQAYQYDLNRFLDYRRESDGAARIRVQEIDDYALKDYLAHLREDRDCRPRTIARNVSSLRAFFQWAQDAGFLEESPAKRIHSPKLERKLPVYLLPTDANEVLTREDEHSPAPERDAAILSLLLMTGIRLSELVTIDLTDVDLESGLIKVMGKGRRERLAPLTESAREALSKWMAVRPGKRESQALFTRNNGERISHRTVQHLVKKTAKRLGLDPRLSPHKLRHTFATTLFAEDTALRDIQELLGHKNIASTSIYTHTNVAKIRQAVNQLKMDGEGS